MKVLPTIGMVIFGLVILSLHFAFAFFFLQFVLTKDMRVLFIAISLFLCTAILSGIWGYSAKILWSA